MLTLVTTAMLTMAAAKANPLNDARKAFNNCMIEVHNAAIVEKQSPSAFIKTSEAACPDQRAAYHAIVVKTDMANKSTKSQAEEFASEEVQYMIDGIVASFNDNVESGGKLVLEK